MEIRVKRTITHVSRETLNRPKGNRAANNPEIEPWRSVNRAEKRAKRMRRKKLRGWA